MQLKTVKDLMDEFDPKWDELRVLMNRFPGAFDLTYREGVGYGFDIELSALEKHLPVEVGDTVNESVFSARADGHAIHLQDKSDGWGCMFPYRELRRVLSDYMEKNKLGEVKFTKKN